MTSEIIYFLGIVLAFVTVLWITFLVRRMGQWRALAQRLGFEYRRTHYSWDDRYPFRMFTEGWRQMVKHLVHGSRDGCKLSACDFWYWTRHAKPRGSQRGMLARARADVGSQFSSDIYERGHARTVCILECEELKLPTMFLRRELAVIDWIKQKQGEQDFDFRDDAAFSDGFVAQGLIESSVRAALGYEVRRLLVEKRSLFATLETNGPYVLIDCGRRVSPAKCDLLFDLVLELRRLWASLS